MKSKKIIRIVTTLIFAWVFALIAQCDVNAGSSFSTATQITVGSSVQGIVNSQKSECYKFTITQNAIVTISARTGGHTQDLTLYVYDGQGEELPNTVYISTSDDNNWGFQSGSETFSLDEGTYYIRAKSYDYDDCNYTITVATNVVSGSGVIIAGNNSCYRSTAEQFNVGNKLMGIAYWKKSSDSLRLGESCHYYKFVVPSTKTVNIQFNIPYNQGDVDFAVSDSAGKTIKYYYLYGKENSNRATFKQKLKKGTYYIAVNTLDYDNTSYEMKTNYTPSTSKITGLKKGKKSMTVKWQKKSGATGYEIQYSLKSNFKSAKKVKVNAEIANKKIAGLKSKKTYYVRVRTYCTSMGYTCYSSWSGKKSVKVK